MIDNAAGILFRSANVVEHRSTGQKIWQNFVLPTEKAQTDSDAFPSQLPNCPSYLSQTTSTERSSRDSILQRKELQVVKAIGASRKDFEEQQTRNNVSSITDLKQKLKTNETW